MSERLILLAGDDVLCDGPRHLPAARRRPSNGRVQVLAHRIEASDGIPPTRWVAKCGARGIIFVDAPVLASRPECFECSVAIDRVPVRDRPHVDSGHRYDTDEERVEARRATWRNSKRRMRAKAAA